MVPVSSAFVLRIVVQVQVPRGLKHARLFRSSSRLVAAAREQTATRSSSRVLDIEDQDSHEPALKRSKLRHESLPAYERFSVASQPAWVMAGDLPHLGRARAEIKIQG